MASQRTPQREHWQVEQRVVNLFDGDAARWPLPKSSLERGSTRMQIRRACDRLVAPGLLVKIGVCWALLPETPAEEGATS